MRTLAFRIAMPSLAAPTSVAGKAAGLIVCGLAALLVAGLLVAAAPFSSRESMTATGGTTAPAKNISAGDLVGFDASGLPVYRLPSISVSVDRQMVLDRGARED